MDSQEVYSSYLQKLANSIGFNTVYQQALQQGDYSTVDNFIESIVERQKLLVMIGSLEVKVDNHSQMLQYVISSLQQVGQPTQTQLVTLPSSLEPAQCIEPIFTTCFIEDHSVRITNKEVGEGLAFIHFIILDQYKKSSTGKPEFKLKDTKTFLLNYFEKIQKTQEGFLTYNRFPIRLKPELEYYRNTYKTNTGKKKK